MGLSNIIKPPTPTIIFAIHVHKVPIINKPDRSKYFSGLARLGSIVIN